jgi:hypothetical protein
MDNIVGGEEISSSYVGDYNQVINIMSRLCSTITHNAKSENKDKKIKIEEQELLDLCPKISSLLSDYDKQSQKIKSQCHLETLIKGTFSLLAVKYPRSVLRLSSLNINLYLKIFDKYLFA